MPIIVKDIRRPIIDNGEPPPGSGSGGATFCPIAIHVTHDWSLGSVAQHDNFALSVGDAFELYKALRKCLEIE